MEFTSIQTAQREIQMSFYSPPVEMTAFRGQYEWIVLLKDFFVTRCERKEYPEKTTCPICSYQEPRIDFEYLDYPFQNPKRRRVQSFASQIRYIIPHIILHYCQEHNHYLDQRIVSVLRKEYKKKGSCVIL